MSKLNRAARGLIGILLALTFAGWGNSEADQRKVFIAFLQDINNQPGLHLLVPSANDEKAFGPYLQHYAVILDFNREMNASMSDFIAQLIKLGFGPNPSSRTIEQIAAAPADLTALKDVVTRMEQLVETRLAKLNADRAALKLPDDLKAVYDKTFDRLVTAPTLSMENYTKTTGSGVDATTALVTYINAHRGKLVVSGMQIQAKDQRTLDEIAPLMKAYQDAGERVIAAQRAMLAGIRTTVRIVIARLDPQSMPSVMQFAPGQSGRPPGQAVVTRNGKGRLLNRPFRRRGWRGQAGP